MPELRWNKTDFIECFGVLPETDEYETYVGYTVARRGLLLLITVRPHESVVELRLQREDRSEDIIHFALLVEGTVEFKREKWGDFLRLSRCRVVIDRFYYMCEGSADEQRQNQAVDVELAVDPDLRVTFV